MVPELTKAEMMICDAENARARIIDVPGKLMQSKFGDKEKIYHSALLDEDYMIVGNYIDDQLKAKNGNGDYVDFSKLMPKDRVGLEEDHRMEMINKGGMSYWVPVSDQESTVISNYSKWEQAFRVFSNIYTDYHPSRAGELIQYNHIIHTASQTFVWENV